MQHGRTDAALEDVRVRAFEIYHECGSVDATATELNLSVDTTCALLGLADGVPRRSGWRLEFPPIGPPAIR